MYHVPVQSGSGAKTIFGANSGSKETLNIASFSVTNAKVINNEGEKLDLWQNLSINLG